MAGYSKRSLIDKLGIKPGFKLCFINPPEGYESSLGELPPVTQVDDLAESPFDFIQFFTKEQNELALAFPRLKAALAQDGMLWISWPKKASNMATDLNENLVRDIGLAHGLVDIKVAAVDDTWSGLKFVYRKKDRT
jgi:hypothetical protein